MEDVDVSMVDDANVEVSVNPAGEPMAESKPENTATTEPVQPTTAPVSSMAGFKKGSTSIELIAIVGLAALIL